MVLATYVSDRLRLRGYILLLGCIIGIIGYIMLLTGPRPAVQYGSTFFVGVGIFPCATMVTGWLANNLAPHYVRATGIGLQTGFASCAGFIATFTYLAQD